MSYENRPTHNGQGRDRKAPYKDPVRRWRAISDWYAELAAMPYWEFQAPMVELTLWVAEQPFAAPLFPYTSHQWLCVGLHPGYRPGLPFFSCGVRNDGQFEFKLWAEVGRSRGKKVVPLEQAREAFREFASLLHGMSGRAEPWPARHETIRSHEPIRERVRASVVNLLARFLGSAGRRE
jgi:hypothetical protein